MIKSLNFKHIFYFWAVAKHSSIRKASTILNVSQSSISEQLKTLEANIGNDLFDRSQKKMSLTSNGLTLFNALDNFFPTIEEIFESIANYKSTDVKFLRIGLCPTLSQEVRHHLCFGFIEDFNYTVKVIQGENQFLIEAFNRDEVDLFFTTNDHTIPKGKYEKFLLVKKRYCIVANQQFADALPKKNKLKSLSKLKFVNYTSDSDLHFKSFSFMHKYEINPIRIAEIDDINLIKNTIRDMNCFSILPLNSVKEEIKNRSLYQIGPIIKEFSCDLTAIYKPKFQTERFYNHLNVVKMKLKNRT